jgi:hypothetical protein
MHHKAKYLSVRDFLISQSTYRAMTAEVKALAKNYGQQVLANAYREVLDLNMSCCYDYADRNIVATFGGLKIVVDENCWHSKVSVSKEFIRTQHPDLVQETQQWMDHFFGFVYPIYVYEGSCLMHPRTFQEMQLELHKGIF